MLDTRKLGTEDTEINKQKKLLLGELNILRVETSYENKCIKCQVVINATKEPRSIKTGRKYTWRLSYR